MSSPSVTLIGYTHFLNEDASASIDYAWQADEDDPQGASALIEFAGRACYQSWERPNPATATNKGYLNHILDVKHFSVLRHGVATFHVQNVSRSLTHELVRHSHLDPSQLSQRYVKLDTVTTEFIVPPLFEGDTDAGLMLRAAWENAVVSYADLLARGEEIAEARGYTKTQAKKAAREAARAVLPNMTPTAIVLTGNHQAWREMLRQRCAYGADAEIRVLAGELFSQLSRLEPNLYQDLALKSDADGLPFLVENHATVG